MPLERIKFVLFVSFVIARVLGRKIALAEFDVLAFVGCLEDVGNHGKDCEHQQDTDRGDNRTVNDTQRWNKETSNYQRDTDGKVQVECNCSVKPVIADSKKLSTFAARSFAH